MCGIVGIVGKTDVAQRLIDGLRRIEYRGYDSAGICTIEDGQLDPPPRRGQARQSRARADGASARAATIGIAHTRWATHGAPTVGNAHPHIVGPVALVHNGIIENFKPLREELIARRAQVRERDRHRGRRPSGRAQVEAGPRRRTRSRRCCRGCTAPSRIAFLFRDHPDMLIGARLGAPLTVGYGEGETYLGSDALALAPLTQRIAYLDEGDWVVVTRDGVEIFDRDNEPVEREIVDSGASSAAGREGQSRAISCRRRYSSSRSSSPRRSELPPPVRARGRAARSPMSISSQSTARHHRRLRHQLLRRHGRQILVRAVRPRAGRHRCRVASSATASRCSSRAGSRCSSRSRARPPTRSPRCATRAAEGQRIAVVVNVPTSSMAREADLLLPTHAGPEIGVASTKAFTCQLAVLAALAANLARDKGRMSARRGARDRRAPAARRRRRSTPRSTMTRRSRRWRI